MNKNNIGLYANSRNHIGGKFFKSSKKLGQNKDKG